MACAHAVIPAGGRGSRIGGGKPERELAGRPLIEYPVLAARAAGLEPIVVVREDTELPGSLAGGHARIVHDRPGAHHPLGGVLAGLVAAEGPVVVIAGDMPFVPVELIAWLAAAGEPLVTCDPEGRVQPLLARYEPAQLEHLIEAVEHGHSATRAVLDSGARVAPDSELERFGPLDRIFFDVDTEADLQRAEQLLSGTA
jgi:molybdopterin-guanine dinucleotide biosynthesis protein A